METIKEKRRRLAELSSKAKTMVFLGHAPSVNNALLQIYEKEGHTKIQNLIAWMKQGYTLKEDVKPLLLWGKPLHVLKNETEPDGIPYFTLVNLYSNLQVKK